MHSSFMFTFNRHSELGKIEKNVDFIYNRARKKERIWRNRRKP